MRGKSIIRHLDLHPDVVNGVIFGWIRSSDVVRWHGSNLSVVGNVDGSEFVMRQYTNFGSTSFENGSAAIFSAVGTAATSSSLKWYLDTSLIATVSVSGAWWSELCLVKVTNATQHAFIRTGGSLQVVENISVHWGADKPVILKGQAGFPVTANSLRCVASWSEFVQSGDGSEWGGDESASVSPGSPNQPVEV